MLQPTNILTKRQLQFLDLFSESPLVNNFYLSGGTALCGFYYPFRYSDDLDFFSFEEFSSQSVIIWIRSIKSKLKYKSFDVQQVFNRNLLFLEFADVVFKTEFTYYPFPTSDSGMYKNITVDSVTDIAANKLFTIYQQPRLRDFYDLFVILQDLPEVGLDKLRLLAKAKFDWDIDILQLTSQFLKVTELQDDPVLLEEITRKSVEQFFLEKIQILSKEVIV